MTETTKSSLEEVWSLLVRSLDAVVLFVLSSAHVKMCFITVSGGVSV